MPKVMTMSHAMSLSVWRGVGSMPFSEVKIVLYRATVAHDTEMSATLARTVKGIERGLYEPELAVVAMLTSMKMTMPTTPKIIAARSGSSSMTV